MYKKIDNVENFRQIIKEENLTIVDFYADWCMPCRMLGPILEEIGKEEESINVLKVNVDEFNELGSDFKVRSIPAVFFIKNGEVLHNAIGFMEKEDIMRIVNKLK